MNLEDQLTLTLFEPEEGGGQIMPETLLPDPPDSKSCLHLCQESFKDHDATTTTFFINLLSFPMI